MESTQERIISAATKLFGENGFRGTTTAEIARTAGVAEGSIYRYFKDKKELFLACVAPVLQETVRRETSVVQGASPREILRNRIIERTRVIREHMAVFNILFTEGHRHPELAQLMVAHATSMVPEAEIKTLNESLSSGVLKRPPNPMIMNIGLTAAIWGMLAAGPVTAEIYRDWPASNPSAPIEEELAEFVCAALMGEATTTE